MDIINMTARELIAAMRAGEIGVYEVAAAFIARIAKHNAALNAVLRIAPDWEARAREIQRADKSLPLYGLPILVKDNIDVNGMPTSAGCAFLEDNIAKADAPVIANLRKNGALILGKTNLTEFANYVSFAMPNGFSSRGGQVISAYPGVTDASGSSTGSAVAVSARLCPVAIGSDTSFSIVGCATIHGVAGIKPPIGALSSIGIVPIAHTLDSAGPIARNIEDAIAVSSAMRAEPMSDIAPIPAEKLRVGVNIHAREEVSENQIARYNALFDRLRASGAEITEISLSVPKEALYGIMRYEFMRDLDAYLANTHAKHKTLKAIIAQYESHPKAMPYGINVLKEAAACEDEAAYDNDMAERARLKAALIPEIAKYDACAMQGPSQVMHLLGLPSLALPMCMAEDGAPRGIILYGADEKRLYSAVMTIQRHCLPIAPPPID